MVKVNSTKGQNENKILQYEEEKIMLGPAIDQLSGPASAGGEVPLVTGGSPDAVRGRRPAAQA